MSKKGKKWIVLAAPCMATLSFQVLTLPKPKDGTENPFISTKIPQKRPTEIMGCSASFFIEKTNIFLAVAFSWTKIESELIAGISEGSSPSDCLFKTAVQNT